MSQGPGGLWNPVELPNFKPPYPRTGMQDGKTYALVALPPNVKPTSSGTLSDINEPGELVCGVWVQVVSFVVHFNLVALLRSSQLNQLNL